VVGRKSRRDATARGGAWNATSWMRRRELSAIGLLVRGGIPCSIGLEDCEVESVVGYSSHLDFMS
jgi:hypothetical protein